MLNEEVEMVVKSIQASGFRGRNHIDSISYTTFSVNYFSLVFPFSIRLSDNSHETLFCKCPKSNPAKMTLFPLTNADCVLGQNEYNSLNFLKDTWPSCFKATYVLAHAFIPETNAIILEYCQGQEFYKWLRLQDLCRKFGLHSNKLSDALSRIGKSHAFFHNLTKTEEPSQGRSIISKVSDYVSTLRSKGVNDKSLKAAIKIFECQSSENVTTNVKCLKGLDVRNMIILSDQSIRMFDPGVIKIGEPESDMARFLATILLLYWGSGFLFFKLMSHPSALASYLDGYSSIREFSHKKLKLYLIKEIMKHWCMGYVALSLKKYVDSTKRLLKHIYLDRFYMHLLSKVINDS